jgi:hypothetical protein
MLTQQHFIFKVDGRMNVNVSAPTQDIAKARLIGNFDSVEFVGINSRLQPYDYEPMSFDWLTRPFVSAPRKPSVFKSAPKPKALSRTEQLIAEGFDQATASVIAAMEKGMTG